MAAVLRGVAAPHREAAQPTFGLAAMVMLPKKKLLKLLFRNLLIILVALSLVRVRLGTGQGDFLKHGETWLET